MRYTQYVHEYTSDHSGDTRYAVGRWDPERGQYIAPLDKSTAQLTGCHSQFARSEAGMDNYPTRRQALRRARYLFSEDWD